MSLTTPADYWNEGNDLLAEAQQRFTDDDHGAVAPLCALAQAHFAAATSRMAILYAEATLLAPQPSGEEVVAESDEESAAIVDTNLRAMGAEGLADD
jgi:hypothetical protein